MVRPANTKMPALFRTLRLMAVWLVLSLIGVIGIARVADSAGHDSESDKSKPARLAVLSYDEQTSRQRKIPRQGPGDRSNTSTLREDHIQVGLSYMLGVPLGTFEETTPNSVNGFDMSASLRIGEGPILVGLEFGYLRAGSRDYTVERIGSMISFVITNHYMQGHVLMRYSPRWWRVRPYAEALIGFRYLITKTEPRTIDSPILLGGQTNLSDSAFSYGFGGGVLIPIQAGTWHIDLGLRYLLSTQAEYLRGGDNDPAHSQRSDLELLTAQFGFVYLY